EFARALLTHGLSPPLRIRDRNSSLSLPDQVRNSTMAHKNPDDSNGQQSDAANEPPNESVFVVPDESLIARRYARRMLDSACPSRYSAIDLSRVEFVSRSVADELVRHARRYSIELVGHAGDVTAMIDAIEGDCTDDR